MASSRFHGVFSSLLGESVPAGEKVGIVPTSLGKAELRGAGGDGTLPKVGQIAVDIYEEGGYLIIKAPIAGVKLADLDIDVTDNVLTIRGKREQCDVLEDGQYYLQECYWGEFSRSVTLPFPINASKVKATFSKDNVLKIFVPKERKVKIVKINEGG